MTLDNEDLQIIRELLSGIACGYEREEFYYHCCDANDVIKIIDEILEGEE